MDATPEELQESLRFLIFRYSKSPSPSIAGKIASCVEELLTHPQLTIAPHERCTYRQMRTYWRLVENLA
jgi:hypothetical protein